MHIPETIELPANWSTRRAGAPIVAIVAHGTVGRNSVEFLRRGGDLPDGSDRRVSIHVLFAKNGTRYRYLPDSVGANHAGFGTLRINGVVYCQGCLFNVNHVTLGFELENLQDGRDPYPESQLLAMGQQINEWRSIHGPLPIVRHGDIDPTRRRDPVNLSIEDMETWAHRAAGPSRSNAATQRFVVIPDATAIVREGPGRRFNEALGGRQPVLTRLASGTEILSDGVTIGEAVIGDPRWVHLDNDIGFIHISALRPL